MLLPLASSFEFIQAKTHGLRSRVYELERLDHLCDLRTIAQLWHRLYPDRDPGDHHELQRRLLADHIHTLESIRRHLPGRLAPLYAWMMRRFQVENLKVLLRAWKAREPLERVAPFLAELAPDMDLDAGRLVRAASLADFLLLIHVPEFHAAAERGSPHYADTGDTFFIETAIEAAYYVGLLERQRRLPAAHRRGTEGLIRREVALYNILAVFRLKLNYGMRLEQVATFLVPGAVPSSRLERIYDYPDFHDMVNLIPSELLPPPPLRALETIADVEQALWERLLLEANRQFYHSVGDLGLVVAFYSIKRAELANLFRVVEGVRYGLAPEAIRAGLIRARPPVAALPGHAQAHSET